MNVLFSSSSTSLCTEPATEPEPGPFLITADPSSLKPLFKITQSWSVKENCKFVVFCNKHRDDMLNSSKKEKWALFKAMAKFIKTRTYIQCKNHYFKSIRIYGSIESMIQELKEQHADFQYHFDSQLQDLDNVSENRLAKENQLQLTPQFELKALMNLPRLSYLRSPYQKPLTPCNNSLEQLSSSSYSIQSSLMRMFYPITKQEQYLRRKQQETMECHRLFRLWVQKVKELMDMAQRQNKSQSHHYQKQKQRQIDYSQPQWEQ